MAGMAVLGRRETCQFSGEETHPQAKSFLEKVRELFGSEEPTAHEEDVA